MNCRQVDKLMDLALDQGRGTEGLTGDRKAHFDAHLASCAQCRAQWEVIRMADAALRTPKPVPAPQGMLAEFRQRLAQEETVREIRQTSRFMPWLWPVASFAAAGAAAALVFGLNLAPGGAPFSRPHSRPVERAQQAPSDLNSFVPTSPPHNSIDEPLAKRNETPPHGAETLGTTGNPSSAAARAKAHDTASPRTALNTPAPITKPQKPTVMALAVPAPHFDFSDRKRGLLRKPTDDRVVRENLAKDRGEGARSPADGLSLGFGGGGDATMFRRRDERAETAGIPIALEANTQQVQSEVLPPEFNVSPAVLTALRRDVDVKVDTVPVREALAQLTERADVVVRLDPAVQPQRVSVRQAGAPLWVALQSVAQQARLKIYPEDNHLVLRPQDAAPAAGGLGGAGGPAPTPLGTKAAAAPPPPAKPAPALAAKPATAPRRRLEIHPDRRAKQDQQADKLALGKSLSERPAERFAETDFENRKLSAVAPAPDPAVWPAAWGALPSKGFEAPKPEDLPPSVANLPQVMDEARIENRSYYFGRQEQLNNALQNGQYGGYGGVYKKAPTPAKPK